MSNAWAIAAVTRTLYNLLNDARKDFSDIPSEIRPSEGIKIKTLPLDRVREEKEIINLFLYRTEINPAWRNMSMPGKVRPGETGYPMLPLNLYYLVTAYGKEGDIGDEASQILLGWAMHILHDHPVLDRAEIEKALASSGLHDQVERVRITPHPISSEEISKLWNAFQTPYRISAAYEASVILIESKWPTKTPPPVLKRSEEDRGVEATASPVPPFPALGSVRPPEPQPSARLDDIITIKGWNLHVDGIVAVRMNNARLQSPIKLDPLPDRTAEQIKVHLLDAVKDSENPENRSRDDLSKLVPGFYTVSLEVDGENKPKWTTNEVAFTLAPTIGVSPTSVSVGNTDLEITIDLEITAKPRLSEKQDVSLLFGNRQIQIPAGNISNPANKSEPTTLRVSVPKVSKGKYVVRLRVDGVDSMPVDFSERPMKFDRGQMVDVT